MTILKITGKPSTAAMAALEPHIARLYSRTGIRVMVVGELAHVSRTQPAPDADQEAAVTMKIAHLEIPNPEQEDAIREVLRALYLERTARGTLTEEGDLQLAKQTIEQAGGIYLSLSMARLAAGIRHTLDYLARVKANDKLTLGEMRHEMDAVEQSLQGVLIGRGNGEDGGDD